jgi:ADP-ribose pyrophosphatase YjhB (NUDIX family)
MPAFADSYLGRLRQVVGDRLLLVPGARIVIEDAEGRILLQRRSDFGMWGLPGGNAEAGEDLAALVRREAAEETGLEISDVQPYGFGCDPRFETVTFPNGDRCQFFAMMFYTRMFRGTPKISDDESTGLDWFSTDRLPNMLPNMRRSVEAYGRYLATREFQMI